MSHTVNVAVGSDIQERGTDIHTWAGENAVVVCIFFQGRAAA